MLNTMKKVFLSLPKQQQEKIMDFACAVPVLRNRADLQARRWVRETYTPFGRAERNRIFTSIARFAHINRPIEGYYFEFGCHEGNTMRMAWDAFRHLFDWHYVAFDSFQGLPEMTPEDESTIFVPGNLATAKDEFVKVVTANGMPRDRLTIVPGYYSDSLTQEKKEELQPKKAAVIYIDCDLYESTIPVLEFCREFLQLGTVIVFDDWNCYHARPDRGEKRAWREFLETYPELKFEEFVSTAEAKSFVYVG